ncbi:hypothetical protein ACROYT_G039372 [Oculina patagonica]
MESKRVLITLIALAFIGTVIEANTLKRVELILSRYKTRTYGDGTYHNPGKGQCTLDPYSPMATQEGWILVAAGPATYQQSLGCGMCLEITGNGEGSGNNPIVGKTKAVVVDQCAAGCGQTGLDLYKQGDGRWKISYKAIDCPTIPGSDGKIQLRFQGSNPWYIKLQARNTKVPTAGIEVLVNGKYHCLARQTDNFFVGTGLGKFSTPLKVRLTAINGKQVETTISEIRNDVSFPTSVQYKGMKCTKKPSSIKCFGQGDKYPYPSGGMKPGAGRG